MKEINMASVAILAADLFKSDASQNEDMLGQLGKLLQKVAAAK